MTLEELERYNAELLAEIRDSAAKDERARQRGLDAMLCPGLEPLIERARKDGKKPEDIAIEANALLRDQIASTGMMDSLKRDAAPAQKVPMCEAPWINGEQKSPYQRPTLLVGANGRRSR